jgi:starvation-inducible outer membrane lipoprotein
MKNLILTVALMLPATSLFAQETEVIRLSEPVQVTDTYEVFGADVSTWEAPVSLSELVASTENYSGKEITLETEVAQVCQKKGCFFVANDGEHSARITFKDYGFFIPTDSKGKKVTLVGTFEVKELSEKQAKHFAEDAGENSDTINGVQKEYTIVATSVKIPKS